MNEELDPITRQCYRIVTALGMISGAYHGRFRKKLDFETEQLVHDVFVMERLLAQHDIMCHNMTKINNREEISLLELSHVISTFLLKVKLMVNSGHPGNMSTSEVYHAIRLFCEKNELDFEDIYKRSAHD